MRHSAARNPKRQRGWTLIESMIALLLVVMGILGVLGSQIRTLNTTQVTVRRAQAIHLIEDLNERFKSNPNALVNLTAYQSSWTDSPSSAVDCSATACTHAQLAQYDLAQWKATLKQVLPGGNATVFLADAETTTDNRRQIGVLISWLANETSGDADYLSSISTSTGSGSIACEKGRTCLLQYIPVSARCVPFFGDATLRLYCAG